MKDGDEVRHRIGGPMMMIIGHQELENESGIWDCVYWSEATGKFETDSFRRFELYRESDLEYPITPEEAFKAQT